MSSSEWRTPDADPLRRLVGQVRNTKREVGQRVNYLLRNAGIHVEKGRVRFAGGVVIEGDLEVPNGIIKNEWLESPVEYRSARASEYGFAITTTQAERGYSSLVVPDGYTQALITVFASLLVKNNTASTQYVYLRAQVRNEDSGSFQYSLRQQVTLASGFWGSLIVPMIVAMDTLEAGETIRGMGLVSASADIAIEENAVCDSELSVTFSR